LRQKSKKLDASDNTLQETLMKICWLGMLAMGLFFQAGTALRAQHSNAQEDEAIKNAWLFSLEEGLKQADKTGIPILVVLRCVP
jgi:hypothetical protein